jgi:hypothetical protein
MGKLDKSLNELASGLIIATLLLGLIALLMIRFGYTRPDNDIWKCLIFSLKGCACAWFFLWGRYSVKELLLATVENSELKLKHAEDKLLVQKAHLEEKLLKKELKLENLKRELETSKHREEALAQKLNAYTRTPSDANKNALKSFL